MGEQEDMQKRFRSGFKPVTNTVGVYDPFPTKPPATSTILYKSVL